ncbi:hypothetical protein [Nonomuraea guangzhouensis]|uniref:Uncharacterized protein n=1 Tax=Nonomuraea guangzhouensis TaxID=1291555 RepID=A0ABW4GQK5_9ACTN|nr:hypothetical protein [Nonomuraea guangzhouensis]
MAADAVASWWPSSRVNAAWATVLPGRPAAALPYGRRVRRGAAASRGSAARTAGPPTRRAFEIVDADGEVVRVTGESDSELFWALRGGDLGTDVDAG